MDLLDGKKYLVSASGAGGWCRVCEGRMLGGVKRGATGWGHWGPERRGATGSLVSTQAAGRTNRRGGRQLTPVPSKALTLLPPPVYFATLSCTNLCNPLPPLLLT